MGIFDNMDKVEIFGKSRWFPPNGKFLLGVKSVKVVDSKKDRNKTFVVVEFEVGETNHADVKEGETRTWTITMNDSGLGDFKAFLTICQGGSIDNAQDVATLGAPAKGYWATGPLNPLEGTLVSLETFAKPKKNSAGDFTVHKFALVELNEAMKAEKEAREKKVA